MIEHVDRALAIREYMARMSFRSGATRWCLDDDEPPLLGDG